MKRLLIGLGNPGKKYQFTRHNVGHLVIDFLKKLDGFVLRKSSVFMNESGREVKKLLDELKISFDNLIVLHDDVDLKLGQFKLQKGRSSAGHKGVESIIGALGTKDFWRLRIGVGAPPQGVETEEYVLEKFNQGELDQIKSSIEPIRDRLHSLNA